ncbi:hypothetical protein D3C75_677460 [compost metagenome]
MAIPSPPLTWLPTGIPATGGLSSPLHSGGQKAAPARRQWPAIQPLRPAPASAPADFCRCLRARVAALSARCVRSEAARRSLPALWQAAAASPCPQHSPQLPPPLRPGGKTPPSTPFRPPAAVRCGRIAVPGRCPAPPPAHSGSRPSGPWNIRSLGPCGPSGATVPRPA